MVRHHAEDSLARLLTLGTRAFLPHWGGLVTACLEYAVRSRFSRVVVDDSDN